MFDYLLDAQYRVVVRSPVYLVLYADNTRPRRRNLDGFSFLLFSTLRLAFGMVRETFLLLCKSAALVKSTIQTMAVVEAGATAREDTLLRVCRWRDVTDRSVFWA
jgi:hypothetical protein